MCAALRGRDDAEATKRRGELRMCVAYALAAHVLTQLNAPTSTSGADDVGRRAMLGRFLLDVPLRAQHRAACVRAALKYNADARNWGIASSIIKLLLTLDPPDKERLAEQARYCDAQLLANANVVPYRFLCFKSLTPIVDAPLRCDLCCALFAGSSIGGSRTCPYCVSGRLSLWNTQQS